MKDLIASFLGTKKPSPPGSTRQSLEGEWARAVTNAIEIMHRDMTVLENKVQQLEAIVKKQTEVLETMSNLLGSLIKNK